MTARTSLLHTWTAGLLGTLACAPPQELPREPVTYTRRSLPTFGALATCTREFQDSVRRAPIISGDPPAAVERLATGAPERVRDHCYGRTARSAAACLAADDPLLLLVLDVRSGAPACAVGPFVPTAEPSSSVCCYRLGYRAE